MAWDIERVTSNEQDVSPIASPLVREQVRSNLREQPSLSRLYPDIWWGDRFWNELRKAGRYKDLLDKIEIPDPPSEVETREELQDILNKQKSDELEKRRAEIIEESEGPPSYYNFMLFLDEIRRPLTADLVNKMISWSLPMTLHFKQL